MALDHGVKKLEDALSPPQQLRAMYAYYGCDTEADIEARIAREPPGKGGALNIYVVLYTCEQEDTRHSHTDEHFWDPCNPPDKGW
jgi:hypothetical protein